MDQKGGASKIGETRAPLPGADSTVVELGLTREVRMKVADHIADRIKAGELLARLGLDLKKLEAAETNIRQRIPVSAQKLLHLIAERHTPQEALTLVRQALEENNMRKIISEVLDRPDAPKELDDVLIGKLAARITDEEKLRRFASHPCLKLEDHEVNVEIEKQNLVGAVRAALDEWEGTQSSSVEARKTLKQVLRKMQQEKCIHDVGL